MPRRVSLWSHVPSHTIVSTRERAQSFLTDEHLQRVVRAYQDFKDEPGFTRVVPIEEIRAKEGNLSIPLYVGGETQAQTDAATETATSALPNALAGWLESSTAVRQSLQSLLTAEKWALF
jgi:type I restriction enzyme M protein